MRLLSCRGRHLSGKRSPRFSLIGKCSAILCLQSSSQRQRQHV